jgi:hypothetical protein
MACVVPLMFSLGLSLSLSLGLSRSLSLSLCIYVDCYDYWHIWKYHWWRKCYIPYRNHFYDFFVYHSMECQCQQYFQLDW